MKINITLKIQKNGNTTMHCNNPALLKLEFWLSHKTTRNCLNYNFTMFSR